MLFILEIVPEKEKPEKVFLFSKIANFSNYTKV